MFNLIGQEYFDSCTIQSLKRYEWGDAILTMYLALDSQMEYIAGSEALQSTHLHLSEPSLDYFARIFYECRGGRLPSKPFLIISNDSIADPSRVPPGRHLMKFLVPGVPYRIKNDKIIENSTKKQMEKNSYKYDWDEIKHQYSDNIIDIVSQKYISNLKNILKKKMGLFAFRSRKKTNNLSAWNIGMWSNAALSNILYETHTSICWLQNM